MNIYLIYRGKVNFPYDTNEAHVIAANVESEVIKMARNLACDEGAAIWDNATIEKVGIYEGGSDKPVLILTSFHAG
jgi:hypothetical protein